MNQPNKQRIIRAMQMVWETLGNEVLAAYEECDEVPCAPRDTVTEFVMDADYLENFGMEPEAVSEFRKLDRETRFSIANEAFPLEYYGY